MHHRLQAPSPAHDCRRRTILIHPIPNLKNILWVILRHEIFFWNTIMNLDHFDYFHKTMDILIQTFRASSSCPKKPFQLKKSDFNRFSKPIFFDFPDFWHCSSLNEVRLLPKYVLVSIESFISPFISWNSSEGNQWSIQVCKYFKILIGKRIQ